MKTGLLLKTWKTGNPLSEYFLTTLQQRFQDSIRLMLRTSILRQRMLLVLELHALSF